MTRVHFEDQGQDFLWWDIDNDGVVQAAGPFQNEIWKGCVTDTPDTLEKGERLLFIDQFGKEMQLKYPITNIERNQRA